MLLWLKASILGWFWFQLCNFCRIQLSMYWKWRSDIIWIVILCSWMLVWLKIVSFWGVSNSVYRRASAVMITYLNNQIFVRITLSGLSLNQSVVINLLLSFPLMTILCICVILVGFTVIYLFCDQIDVDGKSGYSISFLVL